jgi:hypothetical protein
VSYSGTASFASSAASATLTIAKANPVLTWSNPADILFGSALGASQLSATANVPGSFVYTPSAGTVLPQGNNQALRADFTPAVASDYNSATKKVTINVTQTPPPPPGHVNLIVTSRATRDPNTNDVIVNLTVANAGTADAANVRITAARIDGVNASGVPITLGAIAQGGMATAVVRVPGTVGAAGTRHVLSVTGTYTGGPFQMQARLILP